MIKRYNNLFLSHCAPWRMSFWQTFLCFLYFSCYFSFVSTCASVVYGFFGLLDNTFILFLSSFVFLYAACCTPTFNFLFPPVHKYLFGGLNHV